VPLEAATGGGSRGSAYGGSTGGSEGWPLGGSTGGAWRGSPPERHAPRGVQRVGVYGC